MSNGSKVIHFNFFWSVYLRKGYLLLKLKKKLKKFKLKIIKKKLKKIFN